MLDVKKRSLEEESSGNSRLALDVAVQKSQKLSASALNKENFECYVDIEYSNSSNMVK